MRRALAGAAAVAAGLVPASAAAHAPVTARAAQQVEGVEAPCGGAPIRPDRVMTGLFGTELMGDHVLVPFEVPAGTTQVRVKYCWDKPENRRDGQGSHTLDLGLYGPRESRSPVWGGPEFRGWGGSSHPDVQITAEGYGPEALYLETPKANAPGKTTRGFRPGPVEPGLWAVELGVGAVIPRSEGDATGEVAWRVEVELSDDPAFADEPYVPAEYDPRPARREAGWYAGDLHVHAEHSALGDATMRETFDTAFGPQRLDFLTLSDYVAGASWSEIGRWQPRHPGRLIMRSAEVITYQGHWNSHATTTWADYRTGEIHVRGDDGLLRRVRAPRPPADAMAEVRAGGGFTQINHPTIFPSSVPAFRSLCRGCPWDHDPEDSGEQELAAVEVITGPAGLRTADGSLGPNPFIVTAIDFWQDQLARGAKVAAVGSSDSHNAGRTPNPITQSPVGQPATMVHADELSERGIQRGIERRHTYVKMLGVDGPDLRLTATVPGAPERPEAMMGDTVDAAAMDLTASVSGGPGRTLLIRRGRSVVRTVPVAGERSDTTLRVSTPGWYWLQLQRGSTIEAVSSPIWLGERAPLAVRATSLRRQRGVRAAGECTVTGDDARTCRVDLRIRRGRRVRVVRGATAELTGARTAVSVRLPASLRRTVARRKRGVEGTLVFTATDREGRTDSASRRVRLLPPLKRR